MTSHAQHDTHRGDTRAQAPGGLRAPMAVVGGSGGGSGGLSTLCVLISTVKPGDAGTRGGSEECVAGTGAGTV